MSKTSMEPRHQPTLRMLLGDALRKQQFRPYDSELKELLKYPGILPRLWNDWREARKIEFGPGQADPGAIDASEGLRWLGEEFRDKQVTFRTDLVADLGRGRVVHVEQQTKHRELTMLRRMAAYSSLISSYYHFGINLFQIYYYTGDAEVRWKRERMPRATVSVSNWAFENRFYFIDAGSHDSWKMLSSGSAEYAMLGLLARQIPEEEQFVESLVQLIEKRYGNGTSEAADKLVTCLMVSSLRNREEIVMAKISRQNQTKIAREDFKFAARFQPLIDMAVEDRVQTALEARRGAVEDMMTRILTLQESSQMIFPITFLAWCAANLQPHQLDALERRIGSHGDLCSLAEACGIPREALGEDHLEMKY